MIILGYLILPKRGERGGSCGSGVQQKTICTLGKAAMQFTLSVQGHARRKWNSHGSSPQWLRGLIVPYFPQMWGGSPQPVLSCLRWWVHTLLGVTKQEDKWSKLRGVVPSNLGDRAFANSVPSFMFCSHQIKGNFQWTWRQYCKTWSIPQGLWCKIHSSNMNLRPVFFFACKLQPNYWCWHK